MKERIQYIKVVHSYLVITGFVLFVAHVLSQNQEVLKAHEQLQDINNIINDWDETFLVQKALEINKTHFHQEPLGNFKERKIQIGERVILLYIGSPSHTMIPLREELANHDNVRIYESGNSEIPDIESEQIYIRVPWTLREFKTTWDALKKPITIHKAIDITNAIGFYLSPDTTIQLNNIEWSPLSPTDTIFVAFNPINPLVLYDLFKKSGNSDLIASFPEDVKEGYTNYNIPQFILSNKANPEEIILLFATTAETSFSGQKALLKDLSDKYDVGDFKKTFSELNIITKEFDRNYIESLEPILATFSKRSEEQVEIFGAKLPIPAIVSWGTPILLVLSLYYFLHLKNLNRIISEPAIPIEVAWIGIYPDSLSKIATIGSGVLFPALVTIILFISGFKIALVKENFWILTLTILIAIANLIVLLMIAFVYSRIWNKVQTSPNNV